MRRIPFLLVVMAGVLTVLCGSALAAADRHAASPPVNTTSPTIAGTARDGETLTAASGAWSGTAPIAYAFQWQSCNSTGSKCNSIGRATSQNYVVSGGDVKKTIRVEVTATNADGKTQALSAATAVVVAHGAAPASTKQPNPSGTPQEGQTVRVDNGSWSGDKPLTFGYQWQSCTTGSTICTNIAGSTGSTYVIGAGFVGTLLRANVTATNPAGNSSAFSNMTTIVLAKLGAPVNVGLPAISGSTTVGQRLTATTGTWSGTTNGFGYQWARCNSNGTSCAGISGATGQTYGVGNADLGMALRVNVIATNSIGSTTATSAASMIRIATVQTFRFSSVLRAGQEVIHPKGVSRLAVGHFTAKVTGKTLRWTLTFSHLTGRPSATSLNKGLRGVNGIAFKTLCRQCYSGAHGTLTLTASQLDTLKRGRAYVNIHTTKNRYGEIRGQISRVG